jgi:hypothetical protein
MPKYRVRVIRTCIIQEETWLEIEAEYASQARLHAADQVIENPDNFVFDKEWLEEPHYAATEAQAI